MVGITHPYMALIIQQSIYISWGGGGFMRLLIFGVDGWYNPPLHGTNYTKINLRFLGRGRVYEIINLWRRWLV